MEVLMNLFGGIEAGGSKFVCAVGTGPDNLVDEIRFPTTQPRQTIARAIDFFLKHKKDKPLTAVGIGTFGPADPNPSSPTYGFITTTPKPGWANTDFAGTVSEALGLPVNFDTDVNAAALGEHSWGAARGLDNFIYLTIGTGIGGGGMIENRLMHGLIHPEMGHIAVPQDREKDPFAGCCPFHGNCLEGLASGPAMKERWGISPEDMPPDHPGWQLEAEYLSWALVNFICTLSPRRIILGGGVMEKGYLFPPIRARVRELLNGYLRAWEILEDIDNYIVPPALSNRAGVLGALALGRQVGEPVPGLFQ
jgi:fructokinase